MLTALYLLAITAVHSTVGSSLESNSMIAFNDCIRDCDYVSIHLFIIIINNIIIIIISNVIKKESKIYFS